MNEQNFSNHTKFVPMFHFFLLPALLLNLIWAVRWFFPPQVNTMFGFQVFMGHLVNLMVAIALIVMAFLARTFALGVQDRVIRLEERIRYERLLPEDLKPRIGEFTINQLVALRFACDAELPALARKVLDAKISERKAIKQMVQNWRPDYQRV
jgi:Family of unknown function (DUF6526)